VTGGLVNLDTGAAHAFVSEGSPGRARLKAFVQGKAMVMCATALAQFQNAVNGSAGPLEKARAARLLARVTLVCDTPSPRAVALRTTNHLDGEDIIIFGTGDALGAVTMTNDAKGIRAAAAQKVVFSAYVHPSVPLTRR
jgi:Protein of unknown function (DUF1308)